VGRGYRLLNLFGRGCGVFADDVIGIGWVDVADRVGAFDPRSGDEVFVDRHVSCVPYRPVRRSSLRLLQRGALAGAMLAAWCRYDHW